MSAANKITDTMPPTIGAPLKIPLINNPLNIISSMIGPKIPIAMSCKYNGTLR